MPSRVARLDEKGAEVTYIVRGLLILETATILMLMYCLWWTVRAMFRRERLLQDWQTAWNLAEEMCALSSCHQPLESPIHYGDQGHNFMHARLMREPTDLLYAWLREAPEHDEKWWKPIR